VYILLYFKVLIALRRGFSKKNVEILNHGRSATHKLTARGGKETIIAIHRHVQVTGIDALANPW
jgi:hypothetical protein